MRIERILTALWLFLPILTGGCRQPDVPSGSGPEKIHSATSVTKDTGYHVCYGIFEIPRSADVAVTAPASGTVKKILVAGDDYVKAGTPLFILEDAAFLILRQEYLESRYRLDFLREELKRQGELALEKAASLKKLQETELEFRIWETRKASLEQQLALLGIHADSLEAENLVSVITIQATVSGFFEPQVMTGTHIGPEIVLATLTKKTQARLYAEIPEILFEKVHLRQRIFYSLPGEEKQAHAATIGWIDTQVNPVSHRFRIRIKPVSADVPAIPGMQATVFIPVEKDMTNESKNP